MLLNVPQVLEGRRLQFTPANLRAAGARSGNEDGSARPCARERNNKVLGLTLLFKVKSTKGFFSFLAADVVSQCETEISRF